MAEVAGLVLGGIPLAIWALNKYAEPFDAFHHYRTSIDAFRANLILQNRHLRTTLSNVGLGNEPSSEELRECFSTKFPGISRELIIIVQCMDDVTVKLLKNLDLDVDVDEKPKTLPNRAQWEWRRVKHSFSIKKRNKVIEDLRHWNGDLRRSLEKTEVPAEDDSRKVQDLKRRFNNQRCSSIRQCLNSLHRALEAGFCCACSTPHQAAVDLDWTAYESGTSEGFKVAISYRVKLQPPELPDSWRKLFIRPDEPKKLASSDSGLLSPSSLPPARDPSPASLFRSTIERFGIRPTSPVPSPPSTLPDLPNASTAVSASNNIEMTSLCDTVCADCVPRTLTGSLKDPDGNQKRQFFLHHNQTVSSEVIKAVHLKSLLSSHEGLSQQRSPYLPLSAKQRYGIAASIAWSVLHLSGGPWLGDHWDEKQANIFLEKNQDAREVLSWYPSLCYIFSSPTPMEEPPTNQFKYIIPNRAVFTLGLMLIELCINRPISTGTQAGDRATSASMLDDYEAALSKLDEVYSLAGDSYGYAAERCVKFSFQGRDVHKDFDFSQFRQQFYDAVVAPVQATYLMFPDSRGPI